LKSLLSISEKHLRNQTAITKEFDVNNLINTYRCKNVVLAILFQVAVEQLTCAINIKVHANEDANTLASSKLVADCQYAVGITWCDMTDLK